MISISKTMDKSRKEQCMKLPGTDLYLTGGNIMGGLALVFAVPIVLMLVGRVLRPVLKTGIKSGTIAYGKGKELVSDTQESLAEITKEASSEADAESDKAKTAAKKKTAAPSKGTPKNIKKEGTGTQTITDKVFETIKDIGDGVDTATISKKTGLERKQISNALMNLKKAGKVESVKRGVHTAA
jgi:hypothetical protein